MALCGVARRLGIQAKHRTLRSSERVTLRDPDAIERMLKLMGATRSAREWTGKRSDGEARGKANRLANFDDANMRRSAKAAAEASDKVHQAFEILGDNIPDNLRSAGQLRLDHADTSLEQLGNIAEPANHQGRHRRPNPSTASNCREDGEGSRSRSQVTRQSDLPFRIGKTRQRCNITPHSVVWMRCFVPLGL